jgi:radical SAM protein with 4Fe4S-binding SPASM domain
LKTRWNLPRLFNALLVTFSHRARLTQVHGYPRSLWIEATATCDLRCPLCPTGNGTLARPRGVMSFALYQKILDEMTDCINKVYLWNFGEPFLNQSIFSMIQYAKAKGLYVRSSTNGYALHKPEYVQQLLASGLDHLIVSLDGATQASLSQYRVGARFERIVQGLEQLRQAKERARTNVPDIELQFIVMRHNENEIVAMRELATRLHARLSLKTASLQTPAGAPDFELWLPRDPSYSRYELDERGQYQLKGGRRNTCYYLWHALTVLWDGTVVPCCYDPHGQLALGNVSQASLKPMWNNEMIRGLRASIRNGEERHPVCVGCAIDCPDTFIPDSK